MTTIFEEENIHSILAAFYDKLSKEAHITLLLSKENTKNELIKGQTELLLSSYSLEPSRQEEIFAKKGSLYHSIGLPLFELISGIRYVREHVFTSLAQEGKLNDHYLALNTFFKCIIQGYSRGYFHNIINVVYKRHLDELSDTLFYRLHVKWVLDVLDLFSGRIVPYSTLNYERCVFKEWLTSSYATILVKDSANLQEIHDIHRKLYAIAQSIFAFTKSNNYLEAASLLQNFSSESLHIMHFLVKNAFLNFGSRDKFFYSYVLEQQRHKNTIFSIISLRKIVFLRKYHGNEGIAQILGELSKAIKGFLVALDEDNIFVQSSSGDFFIAWFDVDPEIILVYLEALKRFCDNLPITLEENSLIVKTACGVVELNEQTTHANIEKIIRYTLSKAIECTKDVYALSSDETQAAVELINQSEHNISFVQNSLLQNNLDIFFQPIIELSTGLVYDVEALARIRKNSAFINAGAFIDLIHEMEIVVDLDTQILEKITRNLYDIRKVCSNVFINVSPASLGSTKYVAMMVRCLPRFHELEMRPVFELTEQAFLEHFDLVRDISQQFGVKFAVDDFGTGFSSLKTVADLAEEDVIDFIKIDGTLIRNILHSTKTYQILEAAHEMTKKLGLKNVAEYIENEEILHKVKEVGVCYGQGYYFSQALPLEELIEKYAHG